MLRRYYFHRSIITLIIAYALALGATYNGILIGSLQIVSLVVLTIGAIVWWVKIRRGLSSPHTPLDPALALWGIAYLIAALPNWSGRAAIGVWYAGLYAGVWFVLSDLRRQGMPGRWITDAVLFTSIPLIILALAQVGWWFSDWIAVRQKGIEVAFVPPRPPSSLGNPNMFGAVLAMLLPLGWARVRWSLRRQDRVLWAIWLVLALLTLYLTASRGAWLGAALALVVMGVAGRAGRLNPVAWWRDWSRRKRIGIIGAGLIMLILLIFSLSFFDTPRRGTSERQTFYRIAFESFTEHPLTGTGPFTFGRTLLENRSIPPDQPHSHAHNLILNVAAEMGLPGLIALGFTILLIIRQGRRVLQSLTDPAERAHTTACGAALVAFGVQNMVDMPMMVPAVMMLMIGILAAGDAEHAEILKEKERKKVYHFLPLGLWVVTLVTGWWSAKVYADYIRGERLIFHGNYREAAETLRHVSEAQPLIALHHAEYAYACGLAAAAGDETCLQAGIAAYERALDMEPPHADWWANLAVLDLQAEQTDQAVFAAQQAVHYAQDDPGMWLNLGTVYEQIGETTQAEEAYRRVLEIEPTWGQARLWSETALRQDVLAEFPVEETPFKRAQKLWSDGQRDAAMAVFDPVIKHDPTQPAPYFDLARLYIAAGELDQARRYIDAGSLLVHNVINQAWMYAVEAEFARAKGDWEKWQTNLELAGKLVLPDQTGQPLFLYGRDIAHLQFLRLTVRGTLLPQVQTLGPDPALVKWLEDAYSFSPPD